MAISTITSDLINIGKKLEGLTNERIRCLKTFVHCKPLITWLKTELKERQQVKVLVDLAMISAAGQGDLEVARVSCLHVAATGYAALIYDLPKEANFEKFYACCEEVWKNLDADPGLPDKLRDTNRYLEWVKNVKDSHGSVEMNALGQVEAINRRGFYRVGNIKSKVKVKNLDDVLLLHLPPENQKDKNNKSLWKKYSFERLTDLQSKLMLVAGKAEKGNEEVDRFVQIFDAVTHLGNNYVKMCDAGSILFKDLNFVFYCEPKRAVNTQVNFGQNVRLDRFRINPDVGEEIQQMSDFMEECFQEWIEHISVKRTEFYFLNYFTTPQLVILRQEIAKLCFTGSDTDSSDSDSQPLKPSKWIYPMLSLVKENCAQGDLEKAIEAAFRDLAELENIQTEAPFDREMNVDEEDERNATHDAQLVQQFVGYLVESGYSESLALKALASEEVEGPEDKEAGLMWCLSHAEEDMQDSSDVLMDANADTEMQITGSQYSRRLEAKPQSIYTQDLLEQMMWESEPTLKLVLERMWSEHLTKVDRSVADYVSLHHLGLILVQLAQNDKRKIFRKLPPYIKNGKPNLIVCNSWDVYPTVLSLYMYGKGESLPLPTCDEILLCTSDTTAEQVELLWRRATGEEKQGKIFCLVNADLLDYDQADLAERALEKCMKFSTDYKLVVICNQEREDKARMVTSLDRYRVGQIPRLGDESVSAYLKNHYKVSQANTAGQVDPEKCCIRVIKSRRAGVGKSLNIQRFEDMMRKKYPRRDRNDLRVKVPLHEKVINKEDVLGMLLGYTATPGNHLPRIFHIDLAHEVEEGVDDLLFNLLVLGSLQSRDGWIWCRSIADLYLVETTPLMEKLLHTNKRGHDELRCCHRILELVPSLLCWSPTESFEIYKKTNAGLQLKPADYDQLMDHEEFYSEIFQRPFQYLSRMMQNQKVDGVDAAKAEGDIPQMLQVLLAKCGLEDPSWAELRHFVWFLNSQLLDTELSDFCLPIYAEDLPGFKLFVVNFMIHMSKDFATRSLDMAEESPGFNEWEMDTGDDDDDGDVLRHLQLKRHWETSPHPYIFFNPDRHSMTFLGFRIDRPTGNLLDPVSGQILQQNAITQQLYQSLLRNNVDLNENFDLKPRYEKIQKLCLVMGNEFPEDRDDTYELTTDNAKKILAIHMRFRCGIPVIIMGETGCGKTRLIRFMCDLQKPAGAEIKNMILMKVHGGTSEKEIKEKVSEACELASKNRREFPHIDTVLFLDEANTTEAIGLVKEIMCDRSMEGRPLQDMNGLKIVAACNPYRRHSNEMIQKLEHAGLGYHIAASDTVDKLGRIPMRHLVYRVQALPQSMLPLVWDFGQLCTKTEELYIKQMVKRYVDQDRLPNTPNLKEVLASVLAASQDFMREQKDECSFVSLRDVERVLEVMVWFYEHRDVLYDRMDKKVRNNEEYVEDDSDDDGANDNMPLLMIDAETRSLILALGVCYHACLENRKEYRDHVAQFFRNPCSLPRGGEDILEVIESCQDVLLDEIDVGPNIARNQALKENIFMMIVCIEKRIPLFLVGKPGSSKSLAKTIVADAMQGTASKYLLFKTLKAVHMISYQCSPLSTADGIVSTFNQCAKLQEGKNLDEFVSVVVLDEVGLAEDSPRMPLKSLHPLLEDGCQGDEKSEPHKKVAFIGISNWALDPAKMNRGILVQRGVPGVDELVESAKGICQSEKFVSLKIEPYFQPMAEAYLALYNKAQETREFFGLRDFYSLIKMLCGFCRETGKSPTWYELEHSIKRNFGGLDGIKPLEEFEKTLQHVSRNTERVESDPDCSPAGMIQASLLGHGAESNSESRYLLILTEAYAALGILEQHMTDIKDAITIFGSSFRKDQEYTQICRNINKVKVCMETGQTVILLNLENLYESLYDALNQYYVMLGNDKFVDLGLGTHRVKCRVHPNFRLIVVAEKTVVYENFPIPLINRLEKHFLTMSTVLEKNQLLLVEELKKWVKQFSDSTKNRLQFRRNEEQTTPADAFIGFHADTIPSIVLQVTARTEHQVEDTEQSLVETNWAKEIVQKSKCHLLQCAAPDAVVRLDNTNLPEEEQQWLEHQYCHIQKHDCLFDFLQHCVITDCHNVLAQVTTHSKLLSLQDVDFLASELKIQRKYVKLLNLPSFDTEQQFSRQLKEFFNSSMEAGKESLLLVQCDSGNKNVDLIACARFLLSDELRQTGRRDHGKINVVLIVQLPRVAGGCFVSFQAGWLCYHIDELHAAKHNMPSMLALKKYSVSEIFDAAIKVSKSGTAQMDTQTVANTDSSLTVTETEEMDVDNPNHDEPTNQMEIDTPELEYSNTRNENEDHESPEYSLEHMLREENMDIDQLIKMCVHSAAAMLLAETDMEKKRKVDRVLLLQEILTGLSKHTDGTTLLSVLKNRLCLLLKEKEQTRMDPLHATQWLSREAASIDAINKAGTFRRALWQYLEGQISPMLALIIAYADSQNNIDLLKMNNTTEGIYHLWLDMMKDPGITPISYQSLQTAMRGTELSDIRVENRGDFDCRFPFSWLVKEQVDRLVHIANNNNAKTEPVEELVNRLLEESTVGKLLAKATELDSTQSLVNCYLHDYVRMIYKPITQFAEKELQWIERSIQVSVHEAAIRRGEGRQNLTISSIHLAHANIQKRLGLFTGIVQVVPTVIENISHQFEANPGNPLFNERELTIDIAALYIALETLTPTKEDLDNLNGRSEWIQRADSIQSVVATVLAIVNESPDLFGDTSLEFARRIKFMWTRVYTVFLFIINVCPPNSEEGQSVKKCMPLWQFLGDKPDMKTLKSVELVEKFLKVCNKNAAKEMIKATPCSMCKEVMESPMLLPCKHSICSDCVMNADVTENRQCPTCRKPYKDGQTKPANPESKQMKKYQQYKRRCNTFFIKLVGRLCFEKNKLPEESVIQKLLEYVVYRPSKDSELRSRQPHLLKEDESIDPTPVVRLFLLQLLLRASPDEVENHMANYFMQARQLTGSPKDLLELCLLITQCFEDHFEADTLQSKANMIHHVSSLLENYQDDIRSNGLSMDKLESIGCLRFCLGVVASSVVEHWQAFQLGPRNIPREVRNLWYIAQGICEEWEMDGARLYLMKQLCRRYGIDFLTQVSSVRGLYWIIPDQARQQDNVEPDRYVILHENYSQIRETLTKVLLGEPFNKLEEALEAAGQAKEELWFLLALFREVAMSFSSNNPVDRQMQKKMSDFCQTSPLVTNKQLAGLIINNRQGSACSHMQVRPGLPANTTHLQELLHHVQLAITMSQSQLIAPLQTLMTRPGQMHNCYLPTMPEDELHSVREALLAARTQNENPVMYFCPNGHPYVIGNCGRAATKFVCPDCGLNIGGVNYKLEAGNVQAADDNQDQTRPGHILGPANPANPVPTAQRQLTPAATCVLRLLTHAAMYLGVEHDLRGVAQCIVNPANIQVDGVPEFLWQHLQCDLAALGASINKSPDDCLILMHNIIHKITSSTAQHGVNTLNTRPNRADWEAAFAKTFISKVLQKPDQYLEHANKIITSDARLGANTLMKSLYEVGGDENEDFDFEHLENQPEVWSYRQRITIDNLNQVFIETGQQTKDYPLLESWLAQESELRLLRLVPSIVHLQTALCECYHRRIDHAEAMKLTIEDFIHQIQNDFKKEQIRRYLDDYAAAWSIIRSSLEQFALDGKRIPQEYLHRNISKDTRLAELLPSWRMPGLCAMALVHRLAQIQNRFLEDYHTKVLKKELSAVIKIKDATMPQLISYQPREDLLPLVLANCNYSLMVGEGKQIEYDFRGLEKAIEERFVRNRPRLLPIVPEMVFRQESTNAQVFKNLNEKIPQEKLSHAEQHQIITKFQHLHEVADAIATIDIAIGFLVSVGGEPHVLLDHFLRNQLRMEPTVADSAGHCQLRHVQALWLLLCRQRDMLLVSQGQRALDTVADDYREKLTPKQIDELRVAVKQLNKELFLADLYECIVMHINNNLPPNHEDYIDNTQHPLGFVLSEYIESKDGTPSAALTDDGAFPPDIQAKHAVNVWCIVLRFHN